MGGPVVVVVEVVPGMCMMRSIDTKASEVPPGDNDDDDDDDEG